MIQLSNSRTLLSNIINCHEYLSVFNDYLSTLQSLHIVNKL